MRTMIFIAAGERDESVDACNTPAILRPRIEESSSQKGITSSPIWSDVSVSGLASISFRSGSISRVKDSPT